MTEIINEKTVSEYEAFVQSHPKGNFAQSSYWAKQKSAWLWRAIACRGEDGKIKGTLSVLIRSMPGFELLPFARCCMMYASRGPVCDIDDYATMDELFAKAKELAKGHGAYVLKIDPDVPSSETAFTDYMRKYGFELKSGGAEFEAIQPRYVFRLYLNGRSEEELLASFHQKTRYNIRLAMKKGVQVEVCGKEMVPEFGRLMLTTGVRDGFVTRQPQYGQRDAPVFSSARISAPQVLQEYAFISSASSPQSLPDCFAASCDSCSLKNAAHSSCVKTDSQNMHFSLPTPGSNSIVPPQFGQFICVEFCAMFKHSFLLRCGFL